MVYPIEQDKLELEAIVDRQGISKVVDTLAIIAAEKASHIDENWQDKALSAAWTRVSARLDAQVLRIKSLVGD